MTPKAISFTPVVLKAKLRALKEFGICQTRRPLRPTPPPQEEVVAKSGSGFSIFTDKHEPDRFRVAGPVWAVRDLMGVEPGWRPPFGMPGQLLWIRERAKVVSHNAVEGEVQLRYEDGECAYVPWPARLKPPRLFRYVPNGVHREGARYFLEVVEVRAERVAEISEVDALLEGIRRQEHWASSSLSASCYFTGRPHPGRDTSPPAAPASSPCFESAQEAYFAIYDSIYGTGAHQRDWCWVYTLKRAKP